LENLKRRDHSEDLGVDGKMILKWNLGCEGVNWVHLDQDREEKQAVVNMVTNLWLS
jgi:hypothetical protein